MIGKSVCDKDQPVKGNNNHVVCDNSNRAGTESRNKIGTGSGHSVSGFSLPNVSPLWLCSFCKRSDLYCRCLADDDEPDYYDLWRERELHEYAGVSGSSVLLDPQSGESNFNASVMMGTKETTSQIVQFKDQNPAWGYQVDSMPDPSFGAADQNDDSLGEFFARPLKIFDVDWATTNPNFGTTFNPWQLFFTNPRVGNRIANFNNIRCKLHLKFVINGNGFHYGRAIVSYTPLQLLDNTSPTRAFVSQDVIGASQKPHIYLDPTSSLGGDMVLPFFWYNNALRVPTNDWQGMGTIDITAINQLKHANGATDQVRITCFAWAEDMVMSTPTNQNQSTLIPQSDEIILDPQSGEVTGDDEYGKPISGPATSLAKVAGALSTVPGIGLYARASQLALSTVADIAAIFGYCRPVVVDPVQPFRPTYLGNLPQTNVPDSATKLTTDMKQETTVDPRTTGLSGVDELNIRSIVTRESYLTKFPWEIADQAGTRLATFGVTPINWDEFQAPLNTEYHMTPACHAGMLFENWRGTMKYRFQIVASNFHKGRLQVQYDPHDSTENEFNVAYNRVIDIAEEKDFTIEVGWGIPETYGEVMNPGISGLNFRNSGFDLQFPVNNTNWYNGQISIWVLNDLTVPNSEVNNDIEVNVFVTCGDDFEFVNPSDEMINSFTWFPRRQALEAQDGELEYSDSEEEESPLLEPQSGESPVVAPDHDETKDASRPVTTDMDMTVAGNADGESPLNMVCFGESITSIRSLLKRYTLYSFYAAQFLGADRDALYKRRMLNFPLPRGYAPNGINSAPGENYNRVKQTVMGWFAPVFQGWRGGIRRKLLTCKANLPGGAHFMGQASVRRIARPGLGFTESLTPIVIQDNNNEIMKNISNFDMGFSGMIATPIFQNQALEYEIPYHSNLRFHPTRPLEPNANPAVQYENSHEISVYDQVSGTEGGPAFIEYLAAGDDFSFFFYTNVPVCYYFPTDPS